MLGQVQSDIIGIYFHENVTSHNEFDNTGVDDLVDTLGHGNNCCVGEASLGKNGYGIILSYSVFGGGDLKLLLAAGKTLQPPRTTHNFYYLRMLQFDAAYGGCSQ